MGSERARWRCRERLERLADSGGDVTAMRLEAIEVLRSAVGFDRWCALLLDPDSLVVCQGLGHNDWTHELPRLNLIAAGLDDVNSHTILARSRDHVGRLSAATGGDLARARRWDEVLGRYGVGDELRCVAADERGPWGDFMLFRSSDDAPFDAEDHRLMRDVSDVLARGLRRRAVAVLEEPEPAPAETGVVVLDDELHVLGVTPAAREWFEVLNQAHVPFPDGVPAGIWCVVGRLLAIERGEDEALAARARLRGADGRWAIMEAGRLDGPGGGIAVSIRAAGVEDVLRLLCRASGLTAREQELVALLVEGLDTRELAERLVISRYTVQDHLKSVFDKVGVRSRRELVSGVFAQAA
jgi:DNA-binding CsgD family transcriptional regulator